MSTTPSTSEPAARRRGHGTVRRIGAGVAIAGLALAASGCSAITERASEAALERISDGESVDLDLSEGRMTIEDEDGTSISVGATEEVPDQLAAVVPVPDGFVPRSTFSGGDEGGSGVSVAGTLATDDVAAVVEQLEATMVADGWERVHRSEVDGGSLITLGLQRGDDMVTVTAASDDGGESTLNLLLVEAS